MTMQESFTGELTRELAMTRKILAQVPWEKKDWKPHAKSMTLGRLATHIVETLKWVQRILTIEDFDFLVHFPPGAYTAETKEELMQLLQANADDAIHHLSTMDDAGFEKTWTVRRGDRVMLQSSRKDALRHWAFSHHIHHRGQLTVFLRLLDVPVPGMYGPSADER